MKGILGCNSPNVFDPARKKNCSATSKSLIGLITASFSHLSLHLLWLQQVFLILFKFRIALLPLVKATQRSPVLIPTLLKPSEEKILITQLFGSFGAKLFERSSIPRGRMRIFLSLQPVRVGFERSTPSLRNQAMRSSIFLTAAMPNGYRKLAR